MHERIEGKGRLETITPPEIRGVSGSEFLPHDESRGINTHSQNAFLDHY